MRVTRPGFPTDRLDRNFDYVLEKLVWMRQENIWPNGLRYLWTDAFGVVLLVSLYKALDEEQYLHQAEGVVENVERILGRPRGIRIGEEADRDGQYFHYLAMWLYALAVLGNYIPEYRLRGIRLVREIHDAFVLPGHGVVWKMTEDLRAPYPGYGLGALDAYDGYVSYRLLDERELEKEIGEMSSLIERDVEGLTITQDLGIGMMLWMSHFFPTERWARIQQPRCLDMLDRMWQPAKYFSREPNLPEVRIAFANYGVSIGLQSVDRMRDRVGMLHEYFASYRSADEYDRAAITHVMACCAHFPGHLIEFPSRGEKG
jgi:hypothetical protein